MKKKTIANIVMVFINYNILTRTVDVKVNFKSVFLKPFLAALMCGAGAWGANYLLVDVLSVESRLTTLLAVAVGAGFYAVSILFLKGIVKDDILMLPKGEKIAKVLAKFGLLG